MVNLLRYLRLWWALGKYGLIREMTFRGNFLVKISVEVLWLGILLIFYETIFANTSVVADWNRPQYMFFVGCHFALAGVLETLFMSNCAQFADLVRSGDLDFYLLKPMDEQFLITCREVDWSTAPNILIGGGVMLLALLDPALGWNFDPWRVPLFLVLFGCGVALAYSFLLLLTSSSVWLMRNQSLYEIWWLFTTLMRYPREIFTTSWAWPLGWFFTFVLPVMVVIYVPASTMVRVFEPGLAGLTIGAAVLMLMVSRKVFKMALTRYRSASS